MESILEFIRIFNSSENIELFTDNACYWFAIILSNRFSNSKIVYDPHQIHFATKIGNHIYDITGIVEYDEDYVDWLEYQEYADDTDLIIQMCINMRGAD